MIDLALLFHQVQCLANALEGSTEFVVVELEIFFRQSQETEEVELSILFLQHLECNECHQVTGEYPVDRVILFYDALAEHACVLVFALIVDRYFSVRLEVICSIDDAALRIETFAIFSHIVAHHIETGTNRHGDAGTFREELEHEAYHLEASVRIFLLKIAILSVHVQVIFDKFRCLENEMIVDGNGYHEDLSCIVRIVLVDAPLCVDGCAEQTELQLFFDHARTRTGSAREEQTV